MQISRPLNACDPASIVAQPRDEPLQSREPQPDGSVLYHCDASERLERLLHAVCLLRGECDPHKVFQDLFDEQLNRGLMAMAGVEPGPRLIVDNTKKG